MKVLALTTALFGFAAAQDGAGCADIDGSGGPVDVADLLQLLGSFDSADADSDLDGNGIIDVVDLLSLLGQFDSECTRSTGGDDGNGFGYVGCFMDSATRDLRGLTGEGDWQAVSNNVADATQDCMANCDGFQYFGLQWTNACFCGNTYQNREGTNSNTDACPVGECPLSDCDEDGSLQGGLARPLR